MANPLPPPPIKSPDGSYAWLDWYRKLQQYVSQGGSIPWTVIDFTNSNIADIQTRPHNSLQSIQGGSAGEFYHLTNAQVTRVNNAIQSGDTAGGDLSGTYPNPTVSAVHATSGTINGTTIGATTPSTGAFTTLSSTGNFTPSQTNGIVGTTTNNNANAGSVGEYNSSTTTGTSLTSAVAANAASVSLAAGDYDVWGTIVYLPAATTTVSGINAAINTTSATFPASLTQRYSLNATLTTGAGQACQAPMSRISLASTTTIYLVALAVFGVSTMTCDGRLEWRRRR